MARKWAPEKPLPADGNPYSDWFLGSGRAFSIGKREPKEDPEDYEHEFHLPLPTQHVQGATLNARNSPLAAGAQRKILAPLQKRSLVASTNMSATIPSTSIDVSNPAPSVTALAVGTKPLEAIVAVIDDGVNFGHDRFCDPGTGKTRVEYAWVQDGDMQQTSLVPFGREWTKPAIDAAIAANRAKNGNPDALLRSLDLVDFTRFGVRTVSRRMSHGTHMTDLASGYPETPDGAAGPVIDPAEIAMITVQLPFVMTQESSGATYQPFVMDALRYVLQRAQTLSNREARPLPLIINFSYAIAGGPHSGQSALDQSISALLTEHRASGSDGGTVLVLPSGNRYMERGHAEFVAPNEADHSMSLPWRILPGDQTSSFLEIWLPNSATKGTVKVTPPDCPAWTYTVGAPAYVATADKDEDEDDATTDDDVQARISTDIVGNRTRVLIALAPSDTSWMPHTSRRRPAPAGIWQVEVSAYLKLDDVIDAWIQRDESPYLYRANALQSYFDDPEYERFFDERVHTGPGINGDVAQSDSGSASLVKRSGSLSGLATLMPAISTPDPVLIVGGRFGRVGATGRSFTPSLYSAEGLGTPPRGGRSGPEVSAVADRSRVLTGVHAAGTANGSKVAVTGSSVAAPQITRLLAEEVVIVRKSAGAPINAAASQGIVNSVKAGLLAGTAPGMSAVSAGERARLGSTTLGRRNAGQHSLNTPFATPV